MVAKAIIGARDRLGFALFLAVAVHIVIILGMSFTSEDPRPRAHTMSITLARYADKEPPKKADYLAQSNQQGSGTLKKKSRITSPDKAPFQDIKTRKVRPPRKASSPEKVRIVPKNRLTSAGSSLYKVGDQIRKKKIIPLPKKKKISLLERSLEIASLQAQYSEQVREYAKKPRVERLTAASTMKTADAYYIRNWQEKVERVGNLNYPEQARQRDIYGHPRLLVALYPDGSVKEIKVLQSSGYKILDDAAVRIVRLAAPFAPFPESVRKNWDVLEIIRTFSFQHKGLLSY